MKKFYLCTGNIPKGPYGVGELISHGLKETDLIWCEGFQGCKLAVDIAELKSIFTPRPKEATKETSAAPAVKNDNVMKYIEAYTPDNPDKSKYITLFIFAGFGVLALIVYYCILEFSSQ